LAVRKHRKSSTKKSDGSVKVVNGSTSAGPPASESLVLLAALKNQKAYRLLGPRLTKELFPGDLAVLREALTLYWKTAKRDGKAPDASKRTLRMLSRKLAGRRWETIRLLVDQWEATRPPAEAALEKHLVEYIKKEGLMRLAQEILFEGERPKGQLEPKRFRERLDRLCFSYSREEEEQLNYTGARRDYFKEISVGRIPTGIREIDSVIRGGLGQGELGIVMAPPKAGKTAILINFGAAAALAGGRVLHVTLEISRWLVLERLDMCIGGFTTEQLQRSTRNISKARNKINRVGGSIIIQDLSHEAVAPSRLEALIERHLPLSLVVIDYADLMTGEKQKDPRYELREIYQAMRRLAADFALPIWTASQGNRSTMDSEDFGLGQIAEDITKVWTCDVGICAMQTREEKVRKRMRLKVDATRGSSRNSTAVIEMDYDTMSIRELREEEVNATEVGTGTSQKDRDAYQRSSPKDRAQSRRGVSEAGKTGDGPRPIWRRARG